VRERRWSPRLGWAVAVALIVAAWIVVSVAGWFGGTLAAPWAMADAAARLASRGVLLDHAASTVSRVLIGFGAGAAIGVGLAGLAERSGALDSVLRPLLRMSRAVPSVAWLPALAVAFGNLEIASWIAVPLVAATSTFLGFPQAIGEREPSLRPALAQSWVIVVAAELARSRSGLGFLIWEGGQGGDGAQMFLALLIVAVLAGLTDLLLGAGERRRPPRSRTRPPRR
jgi:sulfonate transport system permease protein